MVCSYLSTLYSNLCISLAKDKLNKISRIKYWAWVPVMGAATVLMLTPVHGQEPEHGPGAAHPAVHHGGLPHHLLLLRLHVLDQRHGRQVHVPRDTEGQSR